MKPNRRLRNSHVQSVFCRTIYIRIYPGDRKGSEKLDFHYIKIMKLDLLYATISSKWMKDLNIMSDTPKTTRKHGVSI